MSAAPSATGISDPARRPRPNLVDEQDRRQPERDGGTEVAGRDLAGCDGGRDRPDREAAAATHLADRHEVLEARERLLADELPGPQVVDRGERLLVARGEDLGRGRRPDAGQRVELGRGRPVEVDRCRGLRRLPRVPPAARRREPRRSASSRDGTRIWSPSRRGAARLSSRPARPHRPAGHSHRPRRQVADTRIRRAIGRRPGCRPHRRSRPRGASRGRRRLARPTPTRRVPSRRAVASHRRRRPNPSSLSPNASTKAPTASAIAATPTTRVGRRDLPASPARFGLAAGAPAGPGPAGSSRTRHGVAFGSTHRPPRRDGRATASRATRRLATLGALPTWRRRRRMTLATSCLPAAYPGPGSDPGPTLDPRHG